MRGALLLVPLLGSASALPQGDSSLASGTLSTTSLEGTTKVLDRHHVKLNDLDPSLHGSSSNNSNLSSSSNSNHSSSSSSNSSSPNLPASPLHLSTHDPQLLQLLQGLWEAPASVEPQHRTISGPTPGTTSSAATWPPGRLAAPRSSSTRPRRTASRWAWSRCPWTLPPSRTTSTG